MPVCIFHTSDSLSTSFYISVLLNDSVLIVAWSVFLQRCDVKLPKKKMSTGSNPKSRLIIKSYLRLCAKETYL